MMSRQVKKTLDLAWVNISATPHWQCWRRKKCKSILLEKYMFVRVKQTKIPECKIMTWEKQPKSLSLISKSKAVLAIVVAKQKQCGGVHVLYYLQQGENKVHFSQNMQSLIYAKKKRSDKVYFSRFAKRRHRYHGLVIMGGHCNTRASIKAV